MQINCTYMYSLDFRPRYNFFKYPIIEYYLNVTIITGSNFSVFRFFSVFRVLILADLQQIHQHNNYIIIVKRCTSMSFKVEQKVWSQIQMKKGQLAQHTLKSIIIYYLRASNSRIYLVLNWQLRVRLSLLSDLVVVVRFNWFLMQVKEFLDIRGIQRKYPDWRRRALEVEEREFLVGMSVVSETLSNMGEVGDIAEAYQFTDANQLSNPFMSGQAYM